MESKGGSFGKLKRLTTQITAIYDPSRRSKRPRLAANTKQPLQLLLHVMVGIRSQDSPARGQFDLFSVVNIFFGKVLSVCFELSRTVSVAKFEFSC